MPRRHLHVLRWRVHGGAGAYPPTYLLYRCTERSSYASILGSPSPTWTARCTTRETTTRPNDLLTSSNTYEESTTLYGQVHHEIKLDEDGVKHHTAEMAPAGPLAIAGGPETQEMHR